MISIKSILLAIDFGETTHLAISKASYLARHFDAEIIPLHTVENIVDYPFFHVDTMKLLNDRISSKMEELVETLQGKGVIVNQSLIQEGKPFDHIITTADVMDVDLIVVGASKKNIIEKMLGSTAEKIARSAKQPVWLVHPGESVTDIRDVLCPIDCSPACDLTLNTAIDFCRAFSANLSILHVFPDTSVYANANLEELYNPIPEWGPDEISDLHLQTDKSDFIHQHQYEEFKDYLKRFDLSDLKYQYVVKYGTPANEIIAAVEDSGCDLLVMGAVDKKEATMFFARGTIEDVIRKVHCSLLTIKHKIEDDEDDETSTAESEAETKE